VRRGFSSSEIHPKSFGLSENDTLCDGEYLEIDEVEVDVLFLALKGLNEVGCGLDDLTEQLDLDDDSV
jgi:hypothetical protein